VEIPTRLIEAVMRSCRHFNGMEYATKAQRAAHDDAKTKGYEKGKGGSGFIPCPACAGGTLCYSVDSRNGHMRVKCATLGCVSWIE
jgi:hypothetical protein